MLQPTTVLEIAETATPLVGGAPPVPEITEFCRRLFTKAIAMPPEKTGPVPRIRESVMRLESLQWIAAPVAWGPRRDVTITLLSAPPLITMAPPFGRAHVS